MLPPISYAIRPPATVWRADTGREPPDGTTAADMVRHDASISERFYEFSPEFWAYLGGLPAAFLLWVTFEREHAEPYGPAVYPLPLDIPAFVIAADDKGGFLLLFDDNTTLAETGGFAMVDDPFDADAYLRDNGIRSADAFGPPLTEKERQDPELVEAHAWYINYAREHAANGDEGAQAWLVEHGYTNSGPTPEGEPNKPIEHVPSASNAADEDEQKKKHGRADGPGGPAGFSALAHNIRPDVASAPGGLVVVTTSKNSERDHIIADAPQPHLPQQDDRPARIETALTPAILDKASDVLWELSVKTEGAATTALLQTSEKLSDTAAAMRGEPSAAEREVMKEARKEPMLTLEAIADRPARIETASERLAARIARIEGRDDSDDGRAAERAAVEQRDAEASTKRQDSERRERSGELSSDPAQQSSSARLAARIGRIESREEREADDVRDALGLTQDGKPHGDTGRGL